MKSAEKSIRALIDAGNALANFDPEIDDRSELETAWTAAKDEAMLLLPQPPKPKKIGFVRHLVRGCGTLPYCGAHPGGPIILLLITLGAMAGASKGGLLGALSGAGAMLLVFGSLYIYGAYGRSKEDERISLRNAVRSPPNKSKPIET